LDVKPPPDCHYHIQFTFNAIETSWNLSIAMEERRVD
jgi:hypothetical protein